MERESRKHNPPSAKFGEVGRRWDYWELRELSISTSRPSIITANTLGTMKLLPKRIILFPTYSLISHTLGTSSFIPPLATFPVLTSTRRHLLFSTSSAILASSFATVCPSISQTSLSASKNMSFETGYLNAKDAAALDAELMSTPGFSLDQLMELAGLAVAEAVYQVSSEVRSEGKQHVLVVCG